ncbi:subtilisin inhibitor-like [Aristolochia californica]|uniref:subtilisin inhibitor-like n=1 Tax=Aristolochia californica TaxID=171875 RepID=UPI0035E1B72F
MAEDVQQIGAPQNQGEDQHVSDGVDIPTGGGFLQVINGGSKREWPEVVGLAVEEAEQKIKEDMPRAIFQVLPQGSFVTMDFNLRRVRIFMDESRKVARPPRVG